MNFFRFFSNNISKKLRPVVVFVALLAILMFGMTLAVDTSYRQQYEVTMNSIMRAIADCYAIEGYYPPNMDYLYVNYNVSVDNNKYYVLYEVFAPNIRPTVRLIDKRSPSYE